MGNVSFIILFQCILRWQHTIVIIIWRCRIVHNLFSVSLSSIYIFSFFIYSTNVDLITTVETEERAFQINSHYTITNLSYYYDHIEFQINVLLPCETFLVGTCRKCIHYVLHSNTCPIIEALVNRISRDFPENIPSKYIMYGQLYSISFQYIVLFLKYGDIKRHVLPG